MSTKIAEINKRNDDGSRETISVEEIENGFIISRTWEGYIGKGERKEWKYDTKKTYSETNPLDGAEKQLADFFDE